MTFELLLVEEASCPWCERFDEEIASIYPLTSEGKFAPLRRLDIADANESGINFVSRPRFTPTFILIKQNAEIGRIEGYPGEDFFWGLLEMMLKQHTDYGGNPS